MANGDSKNKVEIEVAIRDMFSTALKTMGRELDTLNKRAAETGAIGSAGFDRFRRSNDQLAESNRRTTASFTAMSTITQTLSRSLIGTAGLAAGFYQVAKSLEEVSVNAIRMKNFSTDTGLATSKIQDLQQTLRRGGFSKGEGDSIIGAMGSMVNNLKAFKESSEIYQALVRSQGGGGIAANLLAIAKTGDNAKVVTEYLKAFNKQTIEGKYYMAQIAGTTVSALQQMADAAEKNRNIKLSPIDQAEADKMHQIWVDLETQFDEIFRRISNNGIKIFGELSDTLKAQGVTTKGIVDWINADTDKFVTYIKATFEDIKAIKQWYDNLKNGGDFGKAFDNAIGSIGVGDSPEKRRKNFEDYTGTSTDKKFPQGEDPMGRDYTSGNDNAGPRRIRWMGKQSNLGTSGSTDFSARARSDDGVNILTDIRDTLQRIELGDDSKLGRGGGDSGGGSGSGGGTYGTGARGGALRAGLGGYRRVSDETIATGGRARGGGGAAGAAGEGRDSEAMPTASGPGGDTNLAGSAFLKSQRERFEKELSDNPQTRKELAALTTLEGNPANVTEAVMNRQSYTGGSIHGAMFNRDRRGRTFYGPINNGKLPGAMAALERDPKRAARVNAAIDEVLAGRNALKGATDQGLPTDPNGKWLGGRVYGLDQVYNDWGGGPGGHEGARRFRENQQRQVMEGGETNRASVDKAQSGGGDKWGKINASVEFLNVPPGVRTKADADGDVFKDLQISKTKQSGVYRQPGQAYD